MGQSGGENPHTRCGNEFTGPEVAGVSSDLTADTVQGAAGFFTKDFFFFFKSGTCNGEDTMLTSHGN